MQLINIKADTCLVQPCTPDSIALDMAHLPMDEFLNDSALGASSIGFLFDDRILKVMSLRAELGLSQWWKVVDGSSKQTMGWLCLDGIGPLSVSIQLSMLMADSVKKSKLCFPGVKALVRYAFHNLRFDRVSVCIAAHDTASLTQFSAFGFVKEGLLRRMYIQGTEWVDVLALSCLRNECRVLS